MKALGESAKLAGMLVATKDALQVVDKVKVTALIRSTAMVSSFLSFRFPLNCRDVIICCCM